MSLIKLGLKPKMWRHRRQYIHHGFFSSTFHPRMNEVVIVTLRCVEFHQYVHKVITSSWTMVDNTVAHVSCCHRGWITAEMLACVYILPFFCLASGPSFIASVTCVSHDVIVIFVRVADTLPLNVMHLNMSSSLNLREKFRKAGMQTQYVRERSLFSKIFDLG